LKAQIEAATEDRDAKSRQRAAKKQQAAADKGELGDTTATKDSDSAYLDDLVSTCEQKSSDFANRQQLRSEELAAIDKAVEILSSGAVTGNADKHLPTLVQLKKAVSFLQLSGAAKNPARRASRSSCARRAPTSTAVCCRRSPSAWRRTPS
jgi:hypothetical protein